MHESDFNNTESFTAPRQLGRGFWSFIIGGVFLAICLIQIEVSRAKSRDIADRPKVTVERIPSSEARRLGVDIRNH